MMKTCFFTSTNQEVPALTTAQMREVDRIAMQETGPNFFQMMENAGRNLAEMALDSLGEDWQQPRVVSEGAGPAATGSFLPCDAYLDFNALAVRINEIAPDAQQLLKTLNDRSTELKVTVACINDLMNARNRPNLEATHANTRGMLAENRPEVHATLHHLNDISQRLVPLVEDLKNPSAQASLSLDHIDVMVGDRKDVRQSVSELRQLLANVNELTGRIGQTMDVNAENIDELMENMNHVSENLKGSLTRSSPGPIHLFAPQVRGSIAQAIDERASREVT